MARSIKFRAWDEIEGKMWVPVISDDGYLLSQHPSGPYLIHEPKGPLMQYTGLKDSKGTEIYEGDIVDVSAAPYATLDGTVGSLPFKGEVIFSSGAFCIKSDVYKIPFAGLHMAVVEVIGNIYEDRELLNG